MAELATIARPYAEALFKASGADLAGAAAWLDELASIGANPQMLQFSGSPSVTPAQVLEVFSGVAQSSKKVSLPVAAKNFLSAVIDNERVSALPEIAKQFRALVNSASGSSDAVVFSAFALSDTALADLTAVLEKRFSRKLNLSVELDSELIGGVRVVVGDEVLDTSVKARLEQMKAALIA
jgi:F-type H+-transporting ATPase subunit delta